jgi:soluble lytic murein transglycosylase-like protein
VFPDPASCTRSPPKAGPIGACRSGRRRPAVAWLARRLAPAALAVLLAAAGQVRPVSGAQAASDCAAAARRAAAAQGVPEDILLTVATIESGRGSEPGWPWTVGHRGTGHWAATRDEALAHARNLIAAGERNLDLGCFQINLHWHASGFPSLEAMFDPDRNAAHAARLLAGHHARTGDWEAAVAAYHSLTPAPAARYLARFRAAWGRTSDPGPAPPAPPDVPQGVAALALLDDGSAAQTAGSLVKAGGLGHRLIGGAP